MVKSLISILLLVSFSSSVLASDNQCVRVEQINPTIISIGFIKNGVCVIPKGVSNEFEKQSN